jgi:1-acyl-sn-glycerol-3-phosphate acyltransferase
VLSPALRLLWHVEVEGIENLPAAGPVILAANHLSFMDSIFLAAGSPRPVAFIAKAEYFETKLGRWAFNRTGQIPLRRGSPASARHAMAVASEWLNAGGTLGIYPEGTRSRDGKLHRGKLGPARLSMETGAPVVPVGLIGTNHVQAPGVRLPRPFRRVTLRFGSPRRFGSPDPQGATGGHDGGPSIASQLRAATAQIMQDIAALSGQAYAGPATAAP